MARRKKDPGPSVSLFPFLSILACVIGVLTLMISALALSQLNPKELEKAEQELAEAQNRAEEHQQLQKTVQAIQSDTERIRKLIAPAEALRQQLADARAEIKRIEQEHAEALERRAEADRQLRQIEERVAELNQLLESVEQLESKLMVRKSPPKPRKVVIQPGGSGTNLKPTFVECHEAGILIHEGPEPVRVPLGALGSDATFHQVLDRIAARNDATIVFLLRSGGVSTFHHARNVARSRFARNGKLPVVGKGEIDLALFQQGGRP